MCAVRRSGDPGVARLRTGRLRIVDAVLGGGIDCHRPVQSPSAASVASAATVIDSASTAKWRRVAGRVSDRPNPSVPSEVNRAGTHWRIWSGTARIQSDTATTGTSPWRTWWT